MPFNFQKTESLSVNNIFNLLRGNLKKMEFPAHKLNKAGINFWHFNRREPICIMQSNRLTFFYENKS